jgi:hypothetical protein
MPQQIGDRVLLSTSEAIKKSGLSRVHIQRLLRNSQLDGVKLGHDWLVVEDSLLAYIWVKVERFPFLAYNARIIHWF